MSKSSSIRHGAAWLFFGGTGSQVLGFLFGIILARLLAPADFGILVTMQIFTGIVGFLAGGGMGQALVRAKEVNKADYDAVFTLQLGIGLFIYLCLFLVAPYFAEWYKTPLYTDLLRVSALSFVLRPFANMPGSILHRNMRFKERSLVGLVVLILSNVSSIIMAWIGLGVWSLVLSGLLASLANILMLSPLAKWRPGFSLDIARAKDIIRYGMLTTVGDLIVYIRSQATNFILSKTLGSHSLGLFNKAGSLVLIPHALVTGPVSQVILRALSKAQDNLNASQYIYLNSISLVSFYSWPAFLSIAWLSLPLINIAYGVKWIDTAVPITWLSVACPFIMLEILAGQVLAARNWLSREIPVQITQLIIVVLGVAAGLSYGLMGVAMGASLANIYGSLHMSWLASRSLSMPISRILLAMKGPFFLNLSVLLLWFGIDHLFAPKEYLGDFFYLLFMLFSGGILYALLFFLMPIPALTSEKERWLKSIRGVQIYAKSILRRYT
jgi:O-antigen/teichoic acid export membrane protein